MLRRFTAIGLLLLILTLSIAAAEPAAAQGGVTWNGTYFNSAFLSGDSVLRRTDSAIAFDWGAGSPDTRVRNDNFSVRWGADVYFPAGTYRFWALADDSVRVVVDFRSFAPVIDTWGQGKANQVVSGDITLSEGNHHIQVDYQELGGDARVYVTWANLATNPSGPNFPAPISPPPPVSTGSWTAQYYTNSSLSGSPTVILSENSPSHNWGGGAPFSTIPADNFSARWTTLQTLNAGTYRITVRADDGVRVYVNGQRVIDQWHGATGLTYTADVTLPFGQHNLMVEYYEAAGDAFLEFAFALVSGGYVPPTVPPVIQPPTNIGLSGSWLATYFNNRDLAGTPAAILSESTPSRNWGAGSPIASVGADNFSVRWTSAQTLSAGTYRITVRADDGVRVYVNGILVINEWRNATGLTYTGDITLPAGTHNFTVEYYEAGGNAFIEFNVGLASASNVGGPANASGSATVTAFRLNVREQPGTSSNVLAKVNRGETYPVVGCNTDRSWWQIDVNGVRGWVFNSFVNVANASCVPVVSATQQPQLAPTGYTVTAIATVNIRSQASTSSAILGQLPSNQAAQVVGRNGSGTWWQINYNNVVGWVSSSYARIQSGADYNRIPVTG
jgi:uncharacterized protein YraI